MVIYAVYKRFWPTLQILITRVLTICIWNAADLCALWKLNGCQQLWVLTGNSCVHTRWTLIWRAIVGRKPDLFYQSPFVSTWVRWKNGLPLKLISSWPYSYAASAAKPWEKLMPYTTAYVCMVGGCPCVHIFCASVCACTCTLNLQLGNALLIPTALCLQIKHYNKWNWCQYRFQDCAMAPSEPFSTTDTVCTVGPSKWCQPELTVLSAQVVQNPVHDHSLCNSPIWGEKVGRGSNPGLDTKFTFPLPFM
jgi:hypothetical protein